MAAVSLCRRGAAWLLALLLLLSLAGCQKDTPMGKSFRFSLSAEPRQLDPQVAEDPASVAVVSALFGDRAEDYQWTAEEAAGNQ